MSQREIPGDDVVCPVGVSAVLPDGPKTAAMLSSLSCDAIPGFEIRVKLGEGGMGVVWRAVQLSTQREVALKTIHVNAFGTRQAADRFAREIKLASRLVHPNISRVYDGGLSGGMLFCAMELIEGIPIDAYVTRHRLDARGVAALMCIVCDAVGYLHGEGIVHRDLKPSNILVSADGQPHLLDFGLAREIGLEAGISVRGEICGTVDYMSPEQARGDSRQIDTRSDVYSLGLLFCALLTGASPRDLSGSSLEVLTRIAGQDVSLPRLRGKPVDTDLRAIVSKALTLEKPGRYFTAGLLADDLRRHLSGRPVNAREPTRLYFMSRFIRRNRLVIGAMMIVLVIITATVWFSYSRVLVARAAEEKRRIIAERLLAGSYLSEGDALGLASRWVEARERYGRSFEVTKALGDSTWPADAAMTEALGQAPPPLMRLAGHRHPIMAMQFAKDSIGAVSVDQSGEVIVWDLPRGRAMHRFNTGGPIICAAISADAQRLFVAHESHGGALWNVADGVQLAVIKMDEKAEAAAFSADGAMVAFGGRAGIPRIWEVAAGDGTRALKGMTGHISALAFSPDGNHLLAGDTDRYANLYTLATGEIRTAVLVEKEVRCAAFSRDGEFVTFGGLDGRVGAMGVGHPEKDARKAGHTSALIAIGDWSHRTVSISGDGQAWVFNTRENLTGWTVCLAKFATRAAVSAEGFVMITGDDGMIDVLQVDTRSEVGKLGTEDMPRAIAMSGSGRLAAHAARDGSIRLRDVETRKHLGHWQSQSAGEISVLEFTPDENELWVGSNGGHLTAIDLLTGEMKPPLAGLKDIRAIRFSRDGRHVVAISGSAAARWRRDTGHLLDLIPAGVSLAWGMSLTPDGEQARVMWQRGGQVGRFDFASRTFALEDVATKPVMAAPHFLADGGVALAHDDHRVLILDDKGGRVLDGHTHEIRSIASSGNGRLILTASFDRTIGIWDGANGALIRRVRGMESGINWIACDEDGKTIIAADDTSMARIWDLRRPEMHRRLAGPAMPALDRLKAGADDAESLRVAGEWFAFRGAHSWAFVLLSEAQNKGALIDPAALARCCWMNGDNGSATRWLDRAIQIQTQQDDLHFLRIWRAALNRTK